MLSVFTKLLLLFLLHKCFSGDVCARYYPRYHLAPPYGWMNDPNGFSIYKNQYHLFYQYNPKSSHDPGIAHWGHAKSNDLFHWEHLPIAMYPDMTYDEDGVFSGSAIVENNTMYLYYTGNVNHPDQTPNHNQYQALATSVGGVYVQKYPGNPIITGEEHQPNIRDPKVWKHHGTYYMVLGNSFNNNTLGRALLYSSKDMVTWKQVSVLDESDGSLGYMWECPDFFQLDGKFVLLFSPQGIKPQGDKYRNLYQTGYLVGNFDYKTNTFTSETDFKELDHGHDFYATQTILDKSGRRTVIAWCDMWEQVYQERNDGWTGQMTIPRILSLTKDNKLIQKPHEQLRVARGDRLFSGVGETGLSVELEDKTGEIRVTAHPLQDFELIIASNSQNVTISYDCKKGKVTLDRGADDGIRRTKWRPLNLSKLHWQIFVDASSVELFCGQGEVTFSSRYFPDDKVRVVVGSNSFAEILTIYKMKRTVPMPEECYT